MTKVIFSSIVSKDNKDAGPKAKNDIENFLVKKGYQKLNLEISRNKIAKYFYSFYGINQRFKGKDYDEVVFQYPIYSRFLTKRFISAIRKYTQAKIIIVVHDVESLRVYRDDPHFYKDEIEIFNSADGLIVHNGQMKSWLKQNGIHRPMVELGIFDYINPNPIVTSKKFDKTVCFAGNLVEEKAGFIQKLKWEKAQLHVFGPNPADSYPDCAEYKGLYSSEELPAHMSENFGLIWDGSSINTCDGAFGDYIKYNAPHKTSLYLSSGMPVIVWKQAAIADFIQKNKVGIAIEDLSQLDEMLDNISEDRYLELKQNAEKLAAQLRNGSFISSAVNEIKRQLED